MSEIQEALEKVLKSSRADDCIAIGSETNNANIRWANNTTTTNGFYSDRQLYVISIKDKRVGTVGRNFFPEDRLEDIVRESEQACEGKPEAEDFMPLLSGEGVPEEWGEGADRTGIEVFSGFASDLADSFERSQKSDVALFGFAEHQTTTYYLATSSGIRRRHTQPTGKLELNAKSPDFKRSVWAGRISRDFTDIDLEADFEHLRQRLEWSKTQIALDPGRYEVLLEPSAVADMLIYLYWTGAARDADEGRNVFSKKGGGNRIGEKLYADGVSIYSDPSESGLEVEPFMMATSTNSFRSVFDNGLDIARVQWARSGVLESLFTTRHWAQKTGSHPVPFVDNLIMEGNGPTLDEMITSTERALMVTCLWYIRQVDPQTLLLTGLTRDGVFLIENGQVKGAVNNFRYNESPIDMLESTIEIGTSARTLPREWNDYFTYTKMPPLRVKEFNMSSVSQAT